MQRSGGGVLSLPGQWAARSWAVSVVAARQSVGKSHGAERKFLMGGLTKVIGKAFGVAAEEYEFTRTAVTEFAQPFGEGVRVQVLSGGVEQDDGGGAVGLEFLQSGIAIADFGDFNRARVADAL